MRQSIGMIGAGTIADAYYLPTLRYLGFTDISIFDTNEQQAKSVAYKHGIRTSSLNTLIEEAAILIIVTPPHSHFALLKQCISAGNKTIICEKPFLFSTQEALEVVALSSIHASTVLVAHLRRCFTAIQSARKTISELPLGRLYRADIWEGGRFSYKPQSDYTTHNMYGGVLLDTGSHALDCFLYVSGLTRNESLCTITEVRKDKQEPSHEVYYAFHVDSIAVKLSLSRFQALSNKMTLYYENGIVEVPLGLKPNIAVTMNGERRIYSSEQQCLNYMSEAFKAELSIMLVQQEYSRFEVTDFVQLSGMLETLYNA